MYHVDDGLKKGGIISMEICKFSDFTIDPNLSICIVSDL